MRCNCARPSCAPYPSPIATRAVAAQVRNPNRVERRGHSAQATSGHKPQKKVLLTLACALAANRHTAKYHGETSTTRDSGGGWPGFFAGRQRRRKINVIVSSGTPAREL